LHSRTATGSAQRLLPVGDVENLCVNKTTADNFKPFIPGMDDLFSEVLGANWYRRTGHQLSSDEMNFLIPLFMQTKRGQTTKDTP
jgi:hypothetical protein